MFRHNVYQIIGALFCYYYSFYLPICYILSIYEINNINFFSGEQRNLPNSPLASKLAETNSNGVDPMKRLSSPDKSASSPGGKSPRG